MHARDDLTTADFKLTIDGRLASFAGLLPGVRLESRVAIVANTPAGAFGVAVTLLGLVTYWYGERARGGEDFFEYPDYFYLQVGGDSRADLGRLEIWPPHKQLAALARTQEVLEAITDREIDYLLIEDRQPGCAAVLRGTRNALPRHLRGALVYDASGVASGAEVAVEGSAAVERHVAHAIESSVELSQEVRDSTWQLRQALARHGRVTDRPHVVGAVKLVTGQVGGPRLPDTKHAVIVESARSSRVPHSTRSGLAIYRPTLASSSARSAPSPAR